MSDDTRREDVAKAVDDAEKAGKKVKRSVPLKKPDKAKKWYERNTVKDIAKNQADERAKQREENSE